MTENGETDFLREKPNNITNLQTQLQVNNHLIDIEYERRNVATSISNSIQNCIEL